MNTKKNIMFFVLIFPIAFLVGVMISLALSLSFQEQVGLDWFVVIGAAVVVDLIITWRNIRDSKEQKIGG